MNFRTSTAARSVSVSVTVGVVRCVVAISILRSPANLDTRAGTVNGCGAEARVPSQVARDDGERARGYGKERERPGDRSHEQLSDPEQRGVDGDPPCDPVHPGQLAPGNRVVAIAEPARHR